MTSILQFVTEAGNLVQMIIILWYIIQKVHVSEPKIKPNIAAKSKIAINPYHYIIKVVLTIPEIIHNLIPHKEQNNWFQELSITVIKVEGH